MSVKTAFTPEDLAFIVQTGRNPETALEQLQRFESGFPSLRLVRPILAGDGMQQLGEETQQALISLFNTYAKKSVGYKFVPASGAASRMFRSLFTVLREGEKSSEKVKKEVEVYMKGLPQFAFYDTLAEALKEEGLDIEDLRQAGDHEPILTCLLSPDKVNLSSLPKGLIPFHGKGDKARTALQEHAWEAALYGKSQGGQAQVHVTVSEEHQSGIEEHLLTTFAEIEKQVEVTFSLETSLQQPQTDTLAVDLDNQPFRLESGGLLFRPGGHGALLENLNQLEADWAFIKNVDNVVPDSKVIPTVHWKKVMGGMLAQTQEKVFSILRKLDDLAPSEWETHEPSWRAFVQEELYVGLPEAYENWGTEEKIDFLRSRLDRPIRVLGCIRTEENTGGGPYWVQADDGSLSLQVVETAQIDMENPLQKDIASRSGYANITFLICGLKDYKGRAFDLIKYRDEQTGFIVEKSLDGRPLKALELPGLWNGAMADWISLFVEVPQAVFNPVKSVIDLLNPMHQA